MRIAILNHLIYELKKGVRDLGLLTLPENLLPQAIECLNKRKISFFTVPLHNQKTNLFFGDDLAVKIAMSFNTKLD